jgi:hypothetical protein
MCELQGYSPGIHQRGDWMGQKAGLEFLEKRKIFCLHREPTHDSSVVQPTSFGDGMSPANPNIRPNMLALFVYYIIIF